MLQYLAAHTMAEACGGNGYAITRAALMTELRNALPESVTVEAAVLQSIEQDGGWSGSAPTAAGEPPGSWSEPTVRTPPSGGC